MALSNHKAKLKEKQKRLEKLSQEALDLSHKAKEIVSSPLYAGFRDDLELHKENVIKLLEELVNIKNPLEYTLISRSLLASITTFNIMMDVPKKYMLKTQIKGEQPNAKLSEE